MLPVLNRLDHEPREELLDDATEGAEGTIALPPIGDGVVFVVAEGQAGERGLGILLMERARLK